jgi:hypothetical protein
VLESTASVESACSTPQQLQPASNTHSSTICFPLCSFQVLVQSQLDEQRVEGAMLEVRCVRFSLWMFFDMTQAVEGFLDYFDTVSDESIKQFLESFAEKELQPMRSVRKAADRAATHIFANHRWLHPAGQRADAACSLLALVFQPAL